MGTIKGNLVRDKLYVLGDNYIEELIRVSLERGYISLRDKDIILNKLMELLLYKIKKYLGGFNSSIDIMTGANINDSDMFVIGEYVSLYSVYDGVNLLLREDIRSIYDKGLEIVREKYNRERMFYEVIFKKNILDIKNDTYYDTLRYGIEGFFKKYNYEYDACNRIINGDYEVMIGRSKRVGINFILEYMKWINYENIILKNYNSREINKMLYRKYGNYSNEVVVNILEEVLINSMVSEYCRGAYFELELFIGDACKIYNDYQVMGEDLLYNQLILGYQRYKKKIKINDDVMRYLDNVIDVVMKRIIIAIKNERLEILLGIKK